MEIKHGYWEYDKAPHKFSFVKLNITLAIRGADLDDPYPDDGCYTPDPKKEKLLLDWCKNNCVGIVGYSYTSGVGFFDHNDALKFKLAWNVE